MKALALAALLAASSAQAQFVDGNTLLQYMNSEIAAQRSSATAYIVGVADASDGTTFCVPAGVAASQLRDMTRTVLVDLPAARHLSAALFVNDALTRVWPCKKQQKAPL